MVAVHRLLQVQPLAIPPRPTGQTRPTMLPVLLNPKLLQLGKDQLRHPRRKLDNGSFRTHH